MDGDESPKKALTSAEIQALLQPGGNPDLGAGWSDPVAQAIEAQLTRQAERNKPPADHPGEQFAEIEFAELQQWLRPREAVTLLGLSWDVATRQLIREAESGRVKTAADSIIWKWGEHKGDESHRYVPSWVWGSSPPKMEDDFWDTGYLTAFGSAGSYGYSIGGAPEVKLFDVRFDPTRLERAAPAPFRPVTRTVPVHATAAETPAPVIAPPVKGAGGARRRDWWDLLWIEMIRRIQAGTLAAKSAAELERLMLDWLATNEIYPGEDTLKKTARNLFKYLEE